MKTAKQTLLEKYLPHTNEQERELWYRTCDWAPQVVKIMMQWSDDLIEEVRSYDWSETTWEEQQEQVRKIKWNI